jgi:cell division protein FtsB
MRKILALLILALSLWGLGQGAAALAAQQNQAADAALDAINQLQAAPEQAGQGLALGQIAERLNRLLP